MIGVFDSGVGGLTVLRALHERFPQLSFVYLADHGNVPYGNRASEEIVELTRAGVEELFRRGAKLVVLGCNTATAVAARTLQRDWLPASGWVGRNVVGIVAPTVEAATQTPWAVTTPQYPQKFNSDTIAVFGTYRTILAGVYPEEIGKRCPRVKVVQQVCAELAGAIEDRAPADEIDRLVAQGVAGLIGQNGGQPPHKAILGCTHFPLVEAHFRAHLPAFARLLSQPGVVADSLDDYLSRHPEYVDREAIPGVELLTTGEPARVDETARIFWAQAPAFKALNPDLRLVGAGGRI
ncbi:MAG: glutamate racemase [Hyphomicrobiaceae bacterium]